MSDISNIKVTTDSTCDLSEDLLKKYNISTTPLYINIEDKSYKDGIEIRPSDIFKYADKTGKLPKTAGVSVKEYIDVFSQYAGNNRAVIHINIGSKFSSCFQNANIAAGDFNNVLVVDSENLSTGTGQIVLEAAAMAGKGMEPQQIIDRLHELIPRIETSFVIDTLDYMRMGGRCSSVTALGANLLNIKPSIEVKNGSMHVVKKYRGNIDNCIEKYVTDRLKNRKDIIPQRLFITHSECSAEIIERTKRLIRQYYGFAEIFETLTSCTISSHCGPGTLGLVFIRK